MILTPCTRASRNRPNPNTNGMYKDARSSIYKPFVPQGDDDEFDDGVFSGWTFVSSGSPVLTVTEDADVCSILHPGGDANAQIHAWLKPRSISVGDYIEAAFRIACNQVASQFPLAGLIFANGATNGSGSQATACYSPTETAGYLMRSFTGFNTSVGSQSLNIGQRYAHVADAIIRLKYQAANTWRFALSPDGVSWVEPMADLSYSMTPTHAGFFVSTWAGGGNVTKAVFSFRYVRFGR